jgi:GDP-L-fucose synthase
MKGSLKTDYWKNRKVMLSGGYGFLGKQITEKLFEAGLPIDKLVVFHRKEYDLKKEGDVKRLFTVNKEIDSVIHLAADVGGIGYNRMFPGTVFYNNIMMNTLMLEYSRLNGAKKFIGIGSVCSYPKYAPLPFKEETLWDGYPEETNSAYGLAKKMLLVQSQTYRQEFRFNAIHLLMVNLYGPGDSFDLDNSHVISGLIRKFVEANEQGKDEVAVWGSGNATREFLYVEDAAAAVILAASRYDNPEPINIGAGFEISIKNLVNLVAALTGYKGKIIWDTSKPDGQPRRCLDVSKAEKEFGFKAKTPFEEGLRETIDWYLINKSVRSKN